MADNPYLHAEEEYLRLKGRLAVGRISREQFDAALKALMLQDAHGRYWMLGADSGKWNVYDGKSWIEATPSSSQIDRMPAPPRSEVDRMPAPPPRIPPPEIYPTPRKDRSLAYLLIGGGLVLVLIIFCALGFLLLNGIPASLSPIAQIPLSSSLPTPPAGVVAATETPTSTANNVTVVATSEPPKLLQPQEFAATSDALTQGIAELNRAELKFIRDAKTSALDSSPRIPGLAIPLPFAPNLLDDDLRAVATQAMSVAQQADDLARSMAGQDNASDNALQAAAQYYSIARLGYALVIDAQNLRDGLSASSVTRAAAINTIADYGARLWNPAVTEPSAQGNPFIPDVKDATTLAPLQILSRDAVAQLKTQIGKDKQVQSWLATSQEAITKTVNVPAPRAPMPNLFDLNLAKSLTTAAGQTDADTSRQVASANLALLTTPDTAPAPTSATIQRQFAVFKGATVADSNQLAAGTVTSFAQGSGNLLSKTTTGEMPLVDDFYALGGVNPPKLTGSTPIKDPNVEIDVRVFGLSVERVEKRPDGLSVVYGHATVKWYAYGIRDPLVRLNCGAGSVDGSAYGVVEVPVRVMAYMTQGGDDYLECSTHWIRNGESKFHESAWLIFRLKEGVITVITATATNTATATPTNTPTATRTPDMSWIDVYVKSIEDQLLAQRPKDAIAIAIVTDDLRRCLLAVVQSGKTQADAKTQCAAALKSLPTLTPTATATATTIAKSLTLNGTFKLPPGQIICSQNRVPVTDSSSAVPGTITLTVDTLTGKASGTFQGASDWTQQTGCDTSYKARMSISGKLDGTIDPKTGTLTMSGSPVQVTQDVCNDSGWCGMGQTSTDEWIRVSGTVDLAKHTGVGKIQWSRSVDRGDWQAQ